MASPRRFLSGKLVIPDAGPYDHRALTHLEDPDQHPIEAITGLEETLETIPPPLKRITNKEMEEILV